MRESNFELLRLVAMFFIVIYHMFLFFLSPIDDNPLYVAIQSPLHIGVPLFVMISGYFGIKFSPKGLFKLLAKTFVLAVPLMLAYCLWQHQGIKEMVKSLLFISHTPFWFIRSYIMLFLVAPVVNHYLENITPTRRLYLMLALGWIAVYLGTVGGDSSLAGGKNLANFLFLYCLGNCVSHCELTSFKKMGGKMAVPMDSGQPSVGRDLHPLSWKSGWQGHIPPLLFLLRAGDDTQCVIVVHGVQEI